MRMDESSLPPVVLRMALAYLPGIDGVFGRICCGQHDFMPVQVPDDEHVHPCLLYTSDSADDSIRV